MKAHARGLAGFYGAWLLLLQPAGVSAEPVSDRPAKQIDDSQISKRTGLSGDDANAVTVLGIRVKTAVTRIADMMPREPCECRDPVVTRCVITQHGRAQMLLEVATQELLLLVDADTEPRVKAQAMGTLEALADQADVLVAEARKCQRSCPGVDPSCCCCSDGAASCCDEDAEVTSDEGDPDAPTDAEDDPPPNQLGPPDSGSGGARTGTNADPLPPPADTGQPPAIASPSL